ncbi:hypothetical protein EDC04DRAFT_3073024 [Pisolithus marmoratus]|nr:hypothetical protein EDC04DRAFT_3073024 [Pisolithus marmoratus]
MTQRCRRSFHGAQVIRYQSDAPGGVESNISESKALTFKLTPASHYVEYQ